MSFFLFSQDKEAATFSLVEVNLSCKQGGEGVLLCFQRVSISRLLSASLAEVASAAWILAAG